VSCVAQASRAAGAGFRGCLAMLLAVSLLLPFAVRAADAPLKSIVMLDFELIDPTLDRASDEAQRERLKKISSLLRQQFIDKGFYRVLDTAPQQAMVDDLKSRFKLYDCNGCETDIGRALGADRVMTAWVQKVSNLILNINIQINDVASGQPVLNKSVDIRGNTDLSWERGIRYMVRSMEEKGQGNR
jgi:hypothetical protein